MAQRPFIETQFPLAVLSAEIYKERKAGTTQTLTSLGKWWGRKPLVLVRAILLALLMPASDDRLSYCVRPEQIEGPGEESFHVINEHLGTEASTLAELFGQLSTKAFGRSSRVGDVFCGAAASPLEAASPVGRPELPLFPRSARHGRLAGGSC